jgi:hypothetical protein
MCDLTWLTFESVKPHKLLKNLGAFSENAKGSNSSTKIKKIKILLLYHG